MQHEMFIMIKVILIIIIQKNYCFLVSKYSVPKVINECDECGKDVEETFLSFFNGISLTF